MASTESKRCGRTMLDGPTARAMLGAKLHHLQQPPHLSARGDGSGCVVRDITYGSLSAMRTQEQATSDLGNISLSVDPCCVQKAADALSYVEQAMAVASLCDKQPALGKVMLTKTKALMLERPSAHVAPVKRRLGSTDGDQGVLLSHILC